MTGQPDAPGRMLVTRTGALIEAAVDGEMFALHPDNGYFYGFNGPATRIWELTAEPRSIAEICAVLLGEFDVDPAECEADTIAVLREIEREGLVALTVPSE